MLNATVLACSQVKPALGSGLLAVVLCIHMTVDQPAY